MIVKLENFRRQERGHWASKLVTVSRYVVATNGHALAATIGGRNRRTCPPNPLAEPHIKKYLTRTNSRYRWEPLEPEDLPTWHRFCADCWGVGYVSEVCRECEGWGEGDAAAGCASCGGDGVSIYPGPKCVRCGGTGEGFGEDRVVVHHGLPVRHGWYEMQRMWVGGRGQAFADIDICERGAILFRSADKKRRGVLLGYSRAFGMYM